VTRTALIAFTDVLFAILFVFFLMPHQPSVAEAEKAVPPGHLTVIATWPSGIDIDVDLWVRAPNQKNAVGYSNKGGPIFNLLRDDLGATADLTAHNSEYSFSRGLPPGEYIVAVHLFSTHGLGADVPVHIEVRRQIGRVYALVASEDVMFDHQGQEITVIRLTFDEQGGVISKSYVPKPIRSARR